jgi:multiple sugar transport system substrate-binding protein
MADIELSVMARVVDPVAGIQKWLDLFSVEHQVQVKVTVFEWDLAWSEILKSALHRRGPDVSEIGSTWISSLIGMNALRPFSTDELAVLGKPSDYTPSIWNSGKLVGEKRIWAYPWLAYTRVIYYRRDLLKKAGVNEDTAFLSNENLIQTLKKISQNINCIPMGIPSRLTNDTLHNLASWVWNSGGDFISQNGQKILFHHKNALEGMKSYFELSKFCPADVPHPAEPEIDFLGGKTAILLSGTNLWPYEMQHFPPQFACDPKNIAAAVIPGVPFIGASHLVIWKHSRHEQQALNLVKYLSELRIQQGYSPDSGLLPVLIDVLEKPPYSVDPIYQVMGQSLKTGRSFPSIPLWGLIENKLTITFEKVWNDILMETHPDIEAILVRRLVPLAEQLQLTLSQE